jgi:hypothetical protein
MSVVSKPSLSAIALYDLAVENTKCIKSSLRPRIYGSSMASGCNLREANYVSDLGHYGCILVIVNVTLRCDPRYREKPYEGLSSPRKIG